MFRRCAVFVLGLCASLACAGPEWPEIGDAGSLPTSAQQVTGNGPLAKINGELQGVPPLPGAPGRGILGDFQDMYLIRIVDPLGFVASTNPMLSGFSEFSSALYLFDIDGFGIVGSIGQNPANPASTITGMSNDGTGSMIVEPGLYYLAIAGRSSFPVAGPDNEPIFNFTFPGEISGPDGSGGAHVIEDWSGPGEFGQYSISLQGAAFIEPACSADLNNDGTLNFFDVQLFLNAFSLQHPLADFVPDGVFDFFDVLEFLNAFSAGCP